MALQVPGLGTLREDAHPPCIVRRRDHYVGQTRCRRPCLDVRLPRLSVSHVAAVRRDHHPRGLRVRRCRERNQAAARGVEDPGLVEHAIARVAGLGRQRHCQRQPSIVEKHGAADACASLADAPSTSTVASAGTLVTFNWAVLGPSVGVRALIGSQSGRPITNGAPSPIAQTAVPAAHTPSAAAIATTIERDGRIRPDVSSAHFESRAPSPRGPARVQS